MSSGFDARMSAAAPVQAQRAGSAPARSGDPNDLLDRDLLVRVGQYDLDALGQLYDRHVGDVWDVALETSGDPGLAQRAVAAAFLALWRKPEPTHPAPLANRLCARVRYEAEPV